MTQPNSLKPCPFCGGEADMRVMQLHMDGTHDGPVSCLTCKARVANADAWNTRPAAPDGSACHAETCSILTLADAQKALSVSGARSHMAGKWDGDLDEECLVAAYRTIVILHERLQAALTTQKAAGASDAGMREAVKKALQGNALH